MKDKSVTIKEWIEPSMSAAPVRFSFDKVMGGKKKTTDMAKMSTKMKTISLDEISGKDEVDEGP